jgi:transglutaminase-like putative cysteine protease
VPPGTRFDSGGALIAAWDPARTGRREFDNFSLDAMGIEHVVIVPAPGAPDPAGGFTLLRRRYEGEALRSVARLRLDRDHRIVEIVQPMFGTSTTIRPADREAALTPWPPYHVVPNAMIRSPFRISDAAARGHIRYRFSFNDGLAFAVPQTAEQRVAAAGDGVTVDICARCGPGLPTDPAYLADARRPTAWLQSDRPEVRGIAAPVAAQGRLSETRKMELLLERARPYLYTLDFSGHYSALDTIRRRAGDCTEAAVLLAALGRAAGIPTRVVNGLVYSRLSYHGVSNAFMPHSWTLAYVDGAWRSFDLALDTFDATHIALTVGDGDARSIQAAGQLASLLRWDAMDEVRPRPAAGPEAQPALPAPREADAAAGTGGSS